MAKAQPVSRKEKQAVLTALRENGDIHTERGGAFAELSRMTGITPQRLRTVTGELADEGVVVHRDAMNAIGVTLNEDPAVQLASPPVEGSEDDSSPDLEEIPPIDETEELDLSSNTPNDAMTDALRERLTRIEEGAREAATLLDTGQACTERIVEVGHELPEALAEAAALEERMRVIGRVATFAAQQ